MKTTTHEGNPYHPRFAALHETLSDAERIDLEERAAVLEYDGNLTRFTAEKIAAENYERARGGGDE